MRRSVHAFIAKRLMSENDYPQNNDQNGSPSNDEEPVELTEDDAAATIAEAAHEEINALNDRILRLAAELDNTRRRAEREKVDAGRYAIANFARDLLGVADNFDRALRAAEGSSAADDAPSTAQSSAMTGLLDGVRMTEKELLSALERHGVHRLFPAGEKFDPNLHQAVAQVPHPTIPSGNVVDVAQPGFTIGERVLRAAMVTVSSGSGDKQSLDNGIGEDGVSGANFDTEV